MTVVRISVASVLSLLLVLSAGCNNESKLVKVEGTVTQNNAPVKGATVTFMYENNDMSSGFTDDTGKFTMTTFSRPGAPIGAAKVSVTRATSTMADMGPGEQLDWKSMQKMYEGKKQDLKTSNEVKNELPAKYANPETSGLVVDIPPGGVSDLIFPLEGE